MPLERTRSRGRAVKKMGFRETGLTLDDLAAYFGIQSASLAITLFNFSRKTFQKALN